MNGYISEVQLFEGFVGAFAAYVAYYILKRKFKSKNNAGIVAGLTFLISWVIRKIFVNNYSFLKSQSESNKITNFLTSYNKFAFIFILISSSIAYYTAIKKIYYYYIVIYVLFVCLFLNLIIHSRGT